MQFRDDDAEEQADASEPEEDVEYLDEREGSSPHPSAPSAILAQRIQAVIFFQ